MKIDFGKILTRGLASGFILLCAFMMLPILSSGEVYIRSLESNISEIPNFDYRVLGGGAMDISINNQKAKSLIIETALSPKDAVNLLYESQSLGDPGDPDSLTTRGFMGVLATDDWAFYADLFRGRIYLNEDGSVRGHLNGKSRFPALAVSAFKNPDSGKTVVNFLMFDGEADLREAFMNLSQFDLGFFEKDKQWGDFSFNQYSGVSLADLKVQLIAEAIAEDFNLDFEDETQQGVFLLFSGRKKTREIFIRNPAESDLGVIVQDRYLKKEG